MKLFSSICTSHESLIEISSLQQSYHEPVYNVIEKVNKFEEYNYLSIDIAMRVKTEAVMLRLATNCDTLQKSNPKGQWE